MQGRWRKTLHTVGLHGCRSNTLQTAAAGSDRNSTTAPTTRAAAPAMLTTARIGRPYLSHHLFRSLGVGRHLDLQHLVRVRRRLALLDLVDHLHAAHHLAHD